MTALLKTYSNYILVGEYSLHYLSYLAVVNHHYSLSLLSNKKETFVCGLVIKLNTTAGLFYTFNLWENMWAPIFFTFKNKTQKTRTY